MMAHRGRGVGLAGCRVLGAILLAGAWCPATSAQVAAPRDGGPQVWAVVIGIERYEDELPFPRCPGASADAVLMARWLIEEAGWGPDHVQLLIDREPSQPVRFRDPALMPKPRVPTRSELDRTVSGWVAQKARRGDVVLIFYAGQAASLPAAGGAVAGRARDYLIPWDGVRDREETWWRLGDAIEGLAARGDLSIVCLLDTSPAGRFRPPRIDGVSRSVPPGRRLGMLEGIARWPGVTAWMAATEETASETAQGHGLLTSALSRVLGTRGREALDLHACLHRLRRDRDLASRGFRAVGEFPLGLSLWPGSVRLALPKVDPLLQRGHADRVTTIAFRGDGGRMITASMDSTIRIWRGSDSFLLNVLPWTSNGYWSLALGGDGRLLVAGGGKGDVLFYDAATETRLPLPGRPPHGGPVTRVAVLADRRHAVTFDEMEGRCAVWDVDLGAGRVRALDPAVARGGSLLAAANGPGEVAFALAVREGKDGEVVRLFDPGGKLRKQLAPPGATYRRPGDPPDPLTALAVSDGGDRVVLGTESGRILVHDSRENRSLADLRPAGGKVMSLSVQPRWLMAACGRSVWIIADPGHPPSELPLGEPVEQVVASADGRQVAACGQQGRVKAWRIAADGLSHEEIPLGEKVGGQGLSLAFSPGGDVLAVGDGNGQVREWRVPGGEPRPEIAGSSGRVGHLAVAPDGRSLLQVTGDGRRHSPGRAVVWRFGGERGTRQVPGSFLQAGGFLPDGRLVLINRVGDLVIHDGVSLEPTPVSFIRPRARNARRPTASMFTTLAISKDGKRIAAGSDDAALACVWSVDGSLVKTIRGHHDKVRAVGFSEDGRRLVTAGDDGLAAIWDLNDPDPVPREPGRVLPSTDPSGPRGPRAILAASLSPADAGILGVGRSHGTLELWRLPEAQPRSLGPLGGDVKAVAFSPDGRWMAAAGDDAHILLVNTADPGVSVTFRTIRDDRRPRPNHFEMITALAFWPDGKLLASASLDSTIRLWSLERKTLLGTLASLDDGSQWVAFTPDGVFDGSRAAERRVTWRLDPNWWPGEGDGLIARFDQLGDRYRQFELTEALSQGREPEPPRAEMLAAPRLIVEPISALGPRRREVVLRIRSSTPDVKDLRLYHNGASLDLAAMPGLKRSGADCEVTIRLVHGKNEIYALGSRQVDALREGGSPEAISNRIELDCREKPPGRLHVVALGISEYRAQALRYADKDAETIAGFLRSKAPEGTSASNPIVLLDRNVTPQAVDDAFVKLRDRVRGRPEDTVVVFLAGHATVRRGHFCLLLPDADLPDAPTARTELAFRGPVEARPQSPLSPLRDPTVLDYRSIHAQLAFVEALQRLVIVDACEAEAIYDVVDNRTSARRAFHRLVDDLSHRARTSYILATRRGERSAEPAELEHGLLTYALLRGMGAPELKPAAELDIFRARPGADLDGDGWIQADELRRYAGEVVPALADRFQGPSRGGATRGLPEPPASLASDVDNSGSFRLIEAPHVARTPSR